MKPLYVISVLVIMVLVITLRYHIKIKQEYTELDALSESIHTIKQHIPTREIVSFIGDTNNTQLYLQARYAMAPAVIFFHTTTDNAKWLLEIKPVVDTTVIPAVAVYQSRDKFYTYRLISNN